jgi:excinuclease ABC subunit B
VIFYADATTDSMRRAIDETRRRREKQTAYNREHGIEPASIVKSLDSPLLAMSNLDYLEPIEIRKRAAPEDEETLSKRIAALEKEMRAAAKDLEFEKAAQIRDELRKLRELQIFRG